MEHFGNDQDREIVELLGRLRETGPEYPPRLYTARRAAVIASLAALPFAGALAVSLFSKLSSTIKAMSVLDKIILGVEVAAITGVSAFGAAAAYVYRDELKSLILGAPTAIVSPFPSLAPPTEPALPPGIEEGTPSPSPTPTGTIFLTDTNQPNVVEPGQTQPAATQPADTQPADTQPPPNATEPGNRYGNTTRTPRPTKGP